MERPSAADVFSTDSAVHRTLMVAVDDLVSMPQSEQRAWALRGLASLLMGSPEALRAAAFERCPELASAEPIPDTVLSVEEAETASRLTPQALQALDSALIDGSLSTWRSAARVIGDAMVSMQHEAPTPPIGVYMRRLQALVQDGRLEARGNTQFMRLSEVRLPTGAAPAAETHVQAL